MAYSPSSSSFQTILLVVFGALFAAGVMVFALATAANNKSSVGTVTIWGTFDQGVVETILRAATGAQPDLAGVKYTQLDAVTYRSAITEALANGSGPDLFFMTQEQSVHDGAKTTHIPSSSVSYTQFQDAFIDAAVPLYAVDGAVALPVLADPLVLFWNRDMLAAGGYASPPQYWDELPGIAQRITQYDEAKFITRAGVAMGEYRNIGTAKELVTMLMLQTGNPIVTLDMSTGKLKLSFGVERSDSKKQVLDALTFYTRFADPADASYSWSRALPPARDAFAQGLVALYVGHASDRAVIAAANPNLNFSVARVPQIRGVDSTIGTARVYALGLSRASKNPNGALTVAYLMAGGTVSTPLALALGMAPAIRSALTPQTQGVDDLVFRSAIVSRSWVDPNPDATGAVFQKMIESVVSGGSDAGAAADDGAQEFNAIIGL